MHGKEYLEIDEKRPMRHAVEIRNESFIDDAFIKLLRKYKVAFVIADTSKRWPEKEDITADFVYIRLHGEEELYLSNYVDSAINEWARRIRAWSEGQQIEEAKLISSAEPPERKSRDIFCYFDNTDKVNAPFNARRLMQTFGLEEGLEPLDWSKFDERGG